MAKLYLNKIGIRILRKQEQMVKLGFGCSSAAKTRYHIVNISRLDRYYGGRLVSLCSSTYIDWIWGITTTPYRSELSICARCERKWHTSLFNNEKYVLEGQYLNVWRPQDRARILEMPVH